MGRAFIHHYVNVQSHVRFRYCGPPQSCVKVCLFFHSRDQEEVLLRLRGNHEYLYKYMTHELLWSGHMSFKLSHVFSSFIYLRYKAVRHYSMVAVVCVVYPLWFIIWHFFPPKVNQHFFKWNFLWNRSVWHILYKQIGYIWCCLQCSSLNLADFSTSRHLLQRALVNIQWELSATGREKAKSCINIQ